MTKKNKKISYDTLPNNVSEYDFYGKKIYVIGCFPHGEDLQIMYGIFSDENQYKECTNIFDMDACTYCKKNVANNKTEAYKEFLIDWKKAIIHYTM